jgi:hypothetical protein
MSELVKSLVGLSTADMIALRVGNTKRTLNADVESIHQRLWDDKDYRAALDATNHADAINGSTVIDDIMAAMMIKDYAVAHNVPMVKAEKLAAIVKSMRKILRKYPGLSRKARAAMFNDDEA